MIRMLQVETDSRWVSKIVVEKLRDVGFISPAWFAVLK